MAVDGRGVAHELRGGTHFEQRKPGYCVVPQPNAVRFKADAAGRRFEAALEMGARINAAFGQQAGLEGVHQRGFQMVQRCAQVQRRQDAPVELEHRFLRTDLELLDSHAAGQGYLRGLEQTQLLSAVVEHGTREMHEFGIQVELCGGGEAGRGASQLR